MAEASKQNVRLEKVGQRHILYDDALVEKPDASLFNPPVREAGTATGRGQAVFFSRDGVPLVLKHYRRGGMVAKLLDDLYIGRSLVRSRAFREWCLLRIMHSQGLPVPVPVAASVTRYGLFYRCDLVTRRIAHAQPLADRLLQQPLTAELWRGIGACLRRFHDRNIYHADLNARNILLDAGDAIHLVDFDKGRQRTLGDAWKNANLARLQRSLLKFRRGSAGFHYEAADWSALLEGYAAGPSAARG